MQAQFVPARAINEVVRYAYPPLLAQLMMPLALLPREQAAQVWLAFNLAAPLTALLITLTSLNWKPAPVVLAGLVLGCLVWLPCAYTYFSGQASLWCLVWTALSLHWMAAGRDGWAGLAGALAWAKPHLLPLLPVLLALAGRRALTTFAGVGLLSLVMALPWLGTWLEAAQASLGANNVDGGWLFQAGLLSSLSLLGPAGLALRIALGGAAVWGLTWLHHHGVRQMPLAAAGLAAGLVITPYIGRSDAALALIPLLMLLHAGRTHPWLTGLALAAWAVPLVCLMVYAFTPYQIALLPAVWGGLMQVSLLLGIAWWLMIELRASRQALNPD